MIVRKIWNWKTKIADFGVRRDVSSADVRAHLPNGSHFTCLNDATTTVRLIWVQWKLEAQKRPRCSLVKGYRLSVLLHVFLQVVSSPGFRNHWELSGGNQVAITVRWPPNLDWRGLFQSIDRKSWLTKNQKMILSKTLLIGAAKWSVQELGVSLAVFSSVWIILYQNFRNIILILSEHLTKMQSSKLNFQATRK